MSGRLLDISKEWRPFGFPLEKVWRFHPIGPVVEFVECHGVWLLPSAPEKNLKGHINPKSVHHSVIFVWSRSYYSQAKFPV